MGDTRKSVVIPLDPEEVEIALPVPHPAPARLGSFVRGELDRAENRAVVRHLLTGCPACSTVLRPLLGEADLPLRRTGDR